MMDLLVCYDVETVTSDGRRRLQRLAKVCLRCGQRVQYSVFECRVSEQSLLMLRRALLREMDESKDSVRIYRLRGERENWLEHFGVDRSYPFDGPLIFGPNGADPCKVKADALPQGSLF
jgi:CRISPR-associated protein Cas2